MRNLEDMSILITGGGSGIGAGLARYLCARGARVTIAGRRADKLREVADTIGPACAPIAADITKDGDRRAMIQAALDHGGKLDALVNNAGNMLRGAIADLAETELTALFAANVIAPMLLTGLAVEPLAATRGAVVMFGSIHSRRAFPGASAYAASRAASEGLARVLAAELGPRGIRVNSIVPGAVPTEINVRAGIATDPAENLARLNGMAPMHPLGRIGTTDEIAEGIDYLIRADWVTGTSLVVDGGLGLGLTGA
jgi:3-oxoacyl-[acyl-carrier protein] reductase